MYGETSRYVIRERYLLRTRAWAAQHRDVIAMFTMDRVLPAQWSLDGCSDAIDETIHAIAASSAAGSVM